MIELKVFIAMDLLCFCSYFILSTRNESIKTEKKVTISYGTIHFRALYLKISAGLNTKL